MVNNDFGLDFGKYWIWENRDALQRRYGAGTYVGVYDAVVVDWGGDPVEIRARVEPLIGDVVYVGIVPPDVDPQDTFAFTDQEFEKIRQYEDIVRENSARRRWRMDFDLFGKIGEVIGDRGYELIHGVMFVDCIVRRYSEHDYRLLVEKWLVPKETILVGGIIFWQVPQREDET